MSLTAVQEIPKFQTIKFIVVCHSEIECDSMHSALSTELTRIENLNWAEDGKILARSAIRRGVKPYLVHDVSH